MKPTAKPEMKAVPRASGKSGSAFPVARGPTGPKAFLNRLSTQEETVFDRAVVELKSSALLNNYRVIQSLVPGQEIFPMLKANGYGHGADWAARTLVHEPGLYAFGVATLQEGADLRSALGSRGRGVPITVFSETSPWSDPKGSFCERHGLTVVIASELDWSRFLKGKWPGRIPYELQFNTGMNRLGLTPAFARVLIRDLRKKNKSDHPQGIFTHLATSESPDAKLTLLQVDRFRALRKELAASLSSSRFHLGNSGVIWNAKKYGLDKISDVVRPGISLYGIPPWSGAPAYGVTPVLSFRAKVVAIHRLKPGESIGYGGTFRVKGKEGIYAAILGAGYGDGVHRSLSNQGMVELNGKISRFLGLISMDLCGIQCSESTAVGAWAEILGEKIDPWAQARAAGTIPYELFTSISSRVRRIYV